VLTRPIDWQLIQQQYDQMIKYATALRSGTAETEAILKRFTRNNLKHPTYLGFAELQSLDKRPSKDESNLVGDNPAMTANSSNAEVAGAPTQSVSILPAGLTDAPAEKDSLGFEYYVKAIKQFLVSPHTKAPLTLSIEGPWGSGKSSFMMQLRNEIAPEMVGAPSRGQKRARSPDSPPIVEFNPWRHDKQEALWAAFALSFVEQISMQCSFWKRASGGIRLFVSRFDLREGWLPAIRALGITATLIVCFFTLPILMLTRGPDWAARVASTLSGYPNAGTKPQGDLTPDFLALSI